MKFFAIGIVLILPLSVFSQTATQKPTQPATQQKPPATQSTQRPATAQPPQRPTTTQPAQRPATGQPVVRPETANLPRTAQRPTDADAAKASIETEEAAFARTEADEKGEREVLRLEDPETGGGRPYRELLKEYEDMHVPHFAEYDIEQRLLSTLLWETSVVKKEDMASVLDVYMVTKEGVFLYNRDNLTLQTIVAGKDMRKSILGNKGTFAEQAPIILIYVANNKKQAQLPVSKKEFYAAMDCGIASQRAYMFCASENLITTTIEVDHVAVGKMLKLQLDKVLLAQPIGGR